MKTTLKEIKNFLRHGKSINATGFTIEEYDAARKAENGFNDIAYSVGVYGVNGVVVQGRKTGMFYVVTCRSSALFLFL